MRSGESNPTGAGQMIQAEVVRTSRGEREEELAAAIGTLGVWDGGLCYASARVAREAAVELEAAGYGTAWLHEGGVDAFAAAAICVRPPAGSSAERAIVSIWRQDASRAKMGNSAHALRADLPLLSARTSTVTSGI
ncbi:MAG TPA: hypothetical protein VLJ76_09695 [Gaiellaceae bacterium]|nr:hypothetical protein [Gaiellaceae bacterium]